MDSISLVFRLNIVWFFFDICEGYISFIVKIGSLKYKCLGLNKKV